MKNAAATLATPPANSAEAHTLANDPRWQLAQRIAASDVFSRSEFLPKFLLYICELYLLERTEEIKEQQIGVRVFGRPESYSPGDDNIVRNYAVQLRKRLRLYFENEGRNEPYEIEIPRGAYVPVFHPRPQAQESLNSLAAISEPIATEQNETDAAPAPAEKRRADWRMFALGVIAGALFISGLLWGWKMVQAATARPAASHPLWSAIFAQDRDTFIVPADSGLGILQNLAESPADLASYESGKYLSNVTPKGIDPSNLNDLRTQRYTSMADLNITSRLAHLPQVVPDHLVVRFARDLRMDDLTNGNAILLGAIHTDPWVGMLQSGLNFQFACGKRVDDCYIRNSHPAAGEEAEYRFSPGDPSRRGYAIIALLRNLHRSGWILLVEGQNMAGTEAAANMLLDDATMRPLLRKMMTPGGTLKPFELLIESSSLDAEALSARIVAVRLDEGS